MNHSKLLIAGAIAATATLAACDSNSPDGGGPVDVGVKGSKGALVGATCQVSPINNPSNILGQCTTGDDGTCDIEGIPGATGAVRLICAGGSFYDEASDSTIDLEPGQQLRSVAPSGTNPVAVTPFTDLLAETFRGSTTATDDDIRGRAANISSFFGVEDILDPPQTVASAADLDGLSGQAGAYAAALAAFSDLSGGDPMTQLDLLLNDVCGDTPDCSGDGNIDSIDQSDFDGRVQTRAQGTNAAGAVNQNQQQADRSNGNGINQTPTGGAG